MAYNFMWRRSTGFTLIELLVVISIIGLLSSVVLASLNSARAKARDVRRISDVRQIQTALAIYRENHGYYPNCAGSSEYIVSGTTECLSAALISDGLISKVPVDPKFRTPGGTWGYDYNYYWTAGGVDFGFRVPLETDIRKQTHAYPGGETCQPDPNPICDWYGSCVYKGYNPLYCSGYTLVTGSK